MASTPEKQVGPTTASDRVNFDLSDPATLKLPGAASLYEQLDKLVVVCLRDGRNFYGWLRSFDQYANLTLDNTVERLSLDNMFANVPIGIFVIRGENVMLLGEVDEAKDLDVTASLKAVPEREMRTLIADRKRGRGPATSKLAGSKPDWPIPEEF